MFGYIGLNYTGNEAIAAHAIAGGAMSVVRGGKFGEGFLSAGFAKYAMLGFEKAGYINLANRKFDAVMGRTTISAVVGGTASVIGGGKFANGAQTAAFAHLLNYESKKMLNPSEIPKGGTACHNDACYYDFLDESRVGEPYWEKGPIMYAFIEQHPLGKAGEYLGTTISLIANRMGVGTIVESLRVTVLVPHNSQVQMQKYNVINRYIWPRSSGVFKDKDHTETRQINQKIINRKPWSWY